MPFNKRYTPKGYKAPDRGKAKVKVSRKKANVGPRKGQMRYVKGAFKPRRFTFEQRMKFRKHRDVRGGRDEGRPRA